MTEALNETPSKAAVEGSRGFMPDDPYEISLEEYDVADPTLFQRNRHQGFFARLREEEPVHYCGHSIYGPYWSVTRYEDIMYVNTHHKIFSSEGGITLRDQDEDFTLPMFIAMDPPKHDVQRKTVAPIVSSRSLVRMESLIRERAAQILDTLPVGETFNWVDRVSIELTSQMLATLFDFPFEERRKLVRWSDVAAAIPGCGIIDTEEQRRAELFECLDYFTRLWNERVNSEQPGFDLISMLAHGEATRNMDRMEYLGNLVLLIVGGNDTTRNSISGGVLALNQNPDQYRKLRENPGLISNMVSEIIRWQTPLAYMRRRALADVKVGDKLIRKGDKVLMWFVSGNRDDRFFTDPDAFLIDRPDARKHLSFGYGIHRCMGNRLAEMQLRVVWEEIMKRFHTVELMAEPVCVNSFFVKGYSDMQVRLHKR